MLVRQLAGALAGQNIHMSGYDGNLAIDAHTARHLTPSEFEEHAAREGYGRNEIAEIIERVEAARPILPPQILSVRRRGGWPLGKPRGPRKKPDILA